jgi:hypothetical protein
MKRAIIQTILRAALVAGLLEAWFVVFNLMFPTERPFGTPTPMDVLLYPGAKLCLGLFRVRILDVDLEDLSMRNAWAMGTLSHVVNSLAYLPIIALPVYELRKSSREIRIFFQVITLLLGVSSVLYGSLWGLIGLNDSDVYHYPLTQDYSLFFISLPMVVWGVVAILISLFDSIRMSKNRDSQSL